MYNFIQSIYFVVTIVYNKLINDPFHWVLSGYNIGSGSGSSIADCVSVCEKDSICVATYIYNGFCNNYRLANGVEKAALKSLSIIDYADTAYAIKQ